MEHVSHLNEMMANLSNEGFAEKSGDIIFNFERQRIQKYIEIVEYARKLVSENKLSVDRFEDTIDKLIDTSDKDYGFPLRILELEKNIDFANQYDEQVWTWCMSSILHRLPDGKNLGITGIDGVDYPLPSLPELSKTLNKQKIELLKTKQKQGFNKLLLVPFAVSLEDLIERYKTTLLRSSGMFNKIEDVDGEPVEVDQNEPIFVWERYNDTSESEEDGLIYYPTDFATKSDGKDFEPEIRGGQSKFDILRSGKGWNVLLIEDIPNMPKGSTSNTIGGRPQLERNRPPEYYLKLLNNEIYSGEQGLTIEDWLAYAITKLDQDKIQIDYNGLNTKGATYNLATCIKMPDRIAVSGCRFVGRGKNQAQLDGYLSFLGARSESTARFAVEI